MQARKKINKEKNIMSRKKYGGCLNFVALRHSHGARWDGKTPVWRERFGPGLSRRSYHTLRNSRGPSASLSHRENVRLRGGTEGAGPRPYPASARYTSHIDPRGE